MPRSSDPLPGVLNILKTIWIVWQLYRGHSHSTHSFFISSQSKVQSKDKTKILSANGSKKFLNVVIWLFFLAKYPSNLSVIDAIINITESGQYRIYSYFDNRDNENENDFIPTKNVVVALAKSIVLKHKVYEQIWDTGALKVAEEILKEV